MSFTVPEPRYEFREVEEGWRRIWEEQGAFQAGPAFSSSAAPKAFSIVIPPPNVTGELHVGHALNQSIQDLCIRTARKLGQDTLWLPGTDHAGIATQVRVEQMLKKEGLDRFSLGREKFIEKIWEWKEKHGASITRQQKCMGFSLDWSRERFTMDEDLSYAVRHVFVRLYEEGLVYRAKRMINWDPESQTVLSDLEIEYDENFEGGELYYFAYLLTEKKGEIVVASTRAETMLGDSAIAVHPDDERYKNLIGCFVEHPFSKRKIRIIADATLVDPTFGTGAVKLSPAHDPNDFAAAERHHLELINIFDERACINKAGAPFTGLERYAARKAVKEELARLGLERGIQAHKMSIARSQRSGAIVEPRISTQWFVKVGPLAKKAKEAVKSGKLRIIPRQWESTYFHWMDEIRDWCISRQLWWGHRIPAWYGPDKKVFVAEDEKEAETQAQEHYQKKVSLERDTDVLDTWFSSALWPFSALGWPKKTKDLSLYYPTTLLVTGFDIIFFWVARMIMMGLHFTKKPPFALVYLHGLMRDEKGQKMSKTKGNVIDPLKAAKAYGTDAFRFFLIATLNEGKDSLYSEQRLKGYQNFANKIWNSSRFILMNLPPDFKTLSRKEEVHKENTLKKILALKLEPEDYWILTRFNETNKEVKKTLGDCKFHLSAEAIYSFFWHEFCDWYIELCKPRIFNKDLSASAEAAFQVLYFVLRNALSLLHPFMPFITEEIDSFFKLEDRGGSQEKVSLLSDSPWPEIFALPARAKEPVHSLNLLQELTHSVRQIRSQANLPPDKKLKLILCSKDKRLAKILSEKKSALERLAKIERIQFTKSYDYKSEKKKSSGAILMGAFSAGEFYVPLEGVLDLEKERAKLQKDLEKLTPLIQANQAKLKNEAFIKNAPEAVLKKERLKLEEFSKKEESLKKALETLA